MNHQRIVTLAFFIGSALLGLVVNNAMVRILVAASQDNTRLGGLLPISVLAGVVAAVVGMVVLLRTEKAVRFTDNAVDELHKVTWPSREETVQSTMVVVGTTIFLAAVLFAYDNVWRSLANYFLLQS